VESSTKHRRSRAQLDAMMRRVLGGVGLAATDDAVTELRDGWFNAAYALRLDDGRRVVVKIAPPPGAEVMTYEQDIMATEVATMRLVATNPAIPLPAVLGEDTTGELCASPYFVMEFVEGQTLAQVAAQLDPATLSAVRRQTGEIVREINGFTGPWFGCPGHPRLQGSTWRDAFGHIVGSVIADGVRRDVDYGHAVDEIHAVMARHAPALDEVTVPRLVHWDVWDANVFVRDGQVTALIDFERALWGDPLMEAQFRQFREPVTDAMRGYGWTTSTPAEQRRLQLYALHLALVMKTECAFRNYDTDHVDVMATWMLRWAMERLSAPG